MAITSKKIACVKVELARFQRALDELEAARHEGRDRDIERKSRNPETRIFVEEDGLPFMHDFPAQTGAVRRASMDLTRALARLRSSKD